MFKTQPIATHQYEVCTVYKEINKWTHFIDKKNQNTLLVIIYLVHIENIEIYELTKHQKNIKAKREKKRKANESSKICTRNLIKCSS